MKLFNTGAALACFMATSLAADPPYDGTIFVSKHIITQDDPSTFESLTYTGMASRTMFDRRPADWVEKNVFLFTAAFSDAQTIEVQVNSEYSTVDAAEAAALRYMHAVGQLPSLLRQEVQTMWVHKGNEAFGGGNENLLVHEEQTNSYIREGILEEALFHESVHTSIDAKYKDDPAWRAAQAADMEFISRYARDNAEHEDLAESMLLAFAVIHRPDRLPPIVRDTIRETMPNRIAFFDALMPADMPLFTNP